MSINRIVISLFVAGYLLVNIRMQINFFAGRNISDESHLGGT